MTGLLPALLLPGRVTYNENMALTTPEKVSVLTGTPHYGGRQEIGALVADAVMRLGLRE